jgi:hypothetical protein
VAAAVRALIVGTPEGTVVVASSLTGAYALEAVDGLGGGRPLVLLTPTGLDDPPAGSGGDGPRPPARRAVGRALEVLGRRTPVGDGLSRALVSRASIGWFLRRQAYADGGRVTDDVIDAYARAGAHPRAKYPLVAFVSGQLSRPVTPAVVGRVRPLVLWGSGQRFVRDAADRWEDAGATVVRLPSGLPQAEEPDTVADLVLALR